MNVKRFGPGLWAACAAIALNSDDKQIPQAARRQYLKFLYSMMECLPCKYCRWSSRTFVKDLPPEAFLYDRAGFCVWVYLFKDRVNQKLGTKSCSFQHFVAENEKYRAKCAAKDGLGCTEPATAKCEEEVAAWCKDALQRYSNYPERVIAFRRQQALQRAAAVAAAIAVAGLLLWLTAPRLRQLARKLK